MFNQNKHLQYLKKARHVTTEKNQKIPTTTSASGKTCHVQ